MEGRFNQDLPKSLQAAFEKAMNFEPCILTKQTINTRRMNKVNKIDVTNYDERKSELRILSNSHITPNQTIIHCRKMPKKQEF